MDLQYTTEQNMLRDSAERFLAENYDHRKFREIASSDAGWSEAIWSEFANLGWLGLPFSEEDGGVGGNAVDVAILMETFGKALVVEPYLSTVVLCGGLVARLGAKDQRQAILPAITEGKLRLAFAHDTAGAPATAVRRGGDFVLIGAKKTVLAAPMADTFLVTASLPGSGIGVFVVPAKTKGLVVRPYRTIDGSRAGALDLGGAVISAAALLGGNENAGGAVEAATHAAISALSADAVGAMVTLVNATVEYAKTRVQFGQPIAKFQVIQHRLVQMKVAEEEARASTRLATLSLDSPALQRSRGVSGAKAKVGRCARLVGQEAIQIHGAIGTTDELSVGGYVKRLMAYEIMFGSTREHLTRYGALIADPKLASEGLLLDPAVAS